MIEIANIENSPVVEVTLEDKLTKDDMKQFDDFFEEKVSDLEKVNLMIVTNDWKGMTVQGFLENIKMARHVKSINKVAMVSDSKFLEVDSRLEDLLTGAKVEYFEKTDKDAAKKWLEL